MKNADTLIEMFRMSQQPLTAAQESTLQGAMAFIDQAAKINLLRLNSGWIKAVDDIIEREDRSGAIRMIMEAIKFAEELKRAGR